MAYIGFNVEEFERQEKARFKNIDYKQLRTTLNQVNISFMLEKCRIGYICPICQNGTGKDGDGLRLMAKNEAIIYKCFKCNQAFNSIQLYTYLKYGTLSTKGRDGLKILQEMANDLNIEVQHNSTFKTNVKPIINDKHNDNNNYINVELMQPLNADDIKKNVLASKCFKEKALPIEAYNINMWNIFYNIPYELKKYKIFNLANAKKIKVSPDGQYLKGAERDNKGVSHIEAVSSIIDINITPYLYLDFRIRDFKQDNLNTLSAPFICIDIDGKAIESQTERTAYLKDLVKRLLKDFNNIYIERSASKTGLHIIFKADKRFLQLIYFTIKHKNKPFNEKIIDLRADNFMAFTGDYISYTTSITNLLYIEDNEQGKKDFKNLLNILGILK